MIPVFLKEFLKQSSKFKVFQVKKPPFRNISHRSSTMASVAAKPSSSLDLEVNRIVWVDMEMTGLDVEQHTILEIACLVTDADLNIVAEGPDIIINQPKCVLEGMNIWSKKQHKKTGLTQACLDSLVGLEEAEDQVLNFIQEHTTEQMSPLAGNSVYMDRMFIIKYMPRLHSYLHYRLIDVSTVKELCRRWNPTLFKQVPNKSFAHRALSDIKESIDELKFYQTNFFKLG